MSRVAGQYSSEEFIPRQTALKRVYAEHFSPQREVGLRNDVLGLASPYWAHTNRRVRMFVNLSLTAKFSKVS